jgi:hypothetical protein
MQSFELKIFESKILLKLTNEFLYEIYLNITKDCFIDKDDEVEDDQKKMF